MLDQPTATRARNRLFTTIRNLLQTIFDSAQVGQHLIKSTINRLEFLVPKLQTGFQLSQPGAESCPNANQTPDKS